MSGVDRETTMYALELWHHRDNIANTVQSLSGLHRQLGVRALYGGPLDTMQPGEAGWSIPWRIHRFTERRSGLRRPQQLAAVPVLSQLIHRPSGTANTLIHRAEDSVLHVVELVGRGEESSLPTGTSADPDVETATFKTEPLTFPMHGGHWQHIEDSNIGLPVRTAEAS